MATKAMTRAEAKKMTYGSSYSPTPYDPARCVCPVSFRDAGWTRKMQCTRKPGHGPDGLYCKQHSPEAVEARVKAQDERHKQRMSEWRPRWCATAMLKIIRQIANGHNDPRGLCSEFMRKYDERG